MTEKEINPTADNLSSAIYGSYMYALIAWSQCCGMSSVGSRKDPLKARTKAAKAGPAAAKAHAQPPVRMRFFFSEGMLEPMANAIAQDVLRPVAFLPAAGGRGGTKRTCTCTQMQL